MTNALRLARERRGWTQRQLADALKCRPGSVSRYEREDSRLNLELMRKIAAVLDCSIAEIAGEVEIDRANSIVDIPELEVELSAGSGSEAGEEALSRVWSFDRDFVSTLGGNADTLRIVTVRGDSMEPELRNGERVAVNTSDVDYRSGGIFAIEWDGGVLVKRLQSGSKPGELIIKSENKNYDPATVSSSEIRVIGRVVLYFRRA